MTGRPERPAEARAAIDAWLAEHPELSPEPLEGRAWSVQLAGDRKRTIPVRLDLGDHTLSVASFFMRAPDENAEELYEYLLRRNLRSYVLRFARQPDGDLLIVGVLPLAAVTTEELDRLAGQLLAVADDAYEHALRTGFAGYIEREQDWRRRTGLPRNPIS